MAACIAPIRVRHGTEFHYVPCGKCNYCLQNRRKQWSFRLQKELREHESAFFLTFTYQDDNLPYYKQYLDDTDTDYKYIPVLHKKHFQDFMKRLRKQHGKLGYGKIKYFAVGEYGSLTGRPHYHAIIFSLSPKIIPQLPTIWGFGTVDVGTVTNNSIDYVTKYVINRFDFEKYPVPPFTLISNGIGLEHLKKNFKHYTHETVVINGRGYKQKLPAYYKNKLGKSKFTTAMDTRKNLEQIALSEQKERARLEKLHSDPDAYIEQRRNFYHNSIAKNAKKGDKL